jgi:hypothetical protein
MVYTDPLVLIGEIHPMGVEQRIAAINYILMYWDGGGPETKKYFDSIDKGIKGLKGIEKEIVQLQIGEMRRVNPNYLFMEGKGDYHQWAELYDDCLPNEIILLGICKMGQESIWAEAIKERENSLHGRGIVITGSSHLKGLTRGLKRKNVPYEVSSITKDMEPLSEQFKRFDKMINEAMDKL